MESNQQLMDKLSMQSDQRNDHASLQQMIRDLGEQLDSAIRSERLAQHRIKQLEDEIKNLKTLEEVGIWWWQCSCDLFSCDMHNNDSALVTSFHVIFTIMTVLLWLVFMWYYLLLVHDMCNRLMLLMFSIYLNGRKSCQIKKISKISSSSQTDMYVLYR